MPATSSDSKLSADPADGPTGRLSARDAAARVACEAHTLRSAARRGAVEGAAKDAEGRWWFDPDGVRRWVGTCLLYTSPSPRDS